ncbi:hypothetical protein [Halogranum rubrum]|uniref:Uncharacterized protein n=1 Tax=Halogranum salarium B-1 TaxID=1210908 RepID=J3EV73_9EURY|nr:hypothetical protein [Halogranum salarium]EJN58462.1 hypothetical protein HSB1_29400 [Halogranum salarium B-1]
MSLVPTGLSAVGRARATSNRQQSRVFDPAVHGFGFRNWATTDPIVPSHDHRDVSEREVRRTIKRDWKDPLESVFDVEMSGLPSTLVNTIAEQVYVTANQLSATNGHCYGMVFTAQQYFERPDTLPFDVDAASDVRHPEAPTERPDSGPVAEEVDLYQTTQALSLYSWFGRRNLINPAWIDYEQQLTNLTAVVDELGTAGITLYDPKTRLAHQALVYDYERSPTGVSLSLYDPNFRARFYKRSANRRAARLFVDTTGDTPTVQPYKTGFRGPGYESFDGFSEFVYNRWDRIIRARSDPDTHLASDVSQTTLRERLLALTMFTVDSDAVAVAVSGPDGNPVSRIASNNMDRRQTECHAMRYRYGAPDGEYHVAITGRRPTDYTLKTAAADTSGELFSSAVTTSIAAGQTHAYIVTIPDTADGDGALERGTGSMPEWQKLAAAAAAGGVVGAGLANYYRGGDDN